MSDSDRRTGLSSGTVSRAPAALSWRSSTWIAMSCTRSRNASLTRLRRVVTAASPNIAGEARAVSAASMAWAAGIVEASSEAAASEDSAR